MNSIILYTKSNTERHAYVFNFVFVDIFGCDINITDDIDVFAKSAKFRINYSTEITEADINIIPHGLLSENDIRNQMIQLGKWNELPIFFQTTGADIPFEIFSAVFYLISRYEEYFPYEPDLYQRYPHTNSLAFKHQFLHLPLVDLWLQELKKLIQSKNRMMVLKENTFRFIPTYDIDIAYSYLGKGLKRNIAASILNFFRGEYAQIKNRQRVLQHKEKDPYDSYEFLDDLHARYAASPIYFFLVGNNGPLDKNLAFESDVMQKLFSHISKKYKVGVHPSYQSHNHIDFLKSEVAKLSSNKSRQHYIRFSLPISYQNLIACNITEDYSMGYGSINGFRASTSYPFQWFDLSNNRQTDLKIFPFCYMECNSFFEQKLSAAQAREEMLHYFETVKKVNGNFITIWHNFSLGTDPLWTGWREIYEDLFDVISSNK